MLTLALVLIGFGVLLIWAGVTNERPLDSLRSMIGI